MSVPKSKICLATAVALTLFAPTLKAATKHDDAQWIGTWAASPVAETYKAAALPSAMTLREVVHVSRGGSSVRVTFTNEFGTDPLTISAAHLATAAQGSDIVPETDKPLTFGGQPSIVIPPGAVAVSDPVAMNLAPLSNLAVSLSLPPQPLHTITAHPLGLQTNYESDGDVAEASTLSAPRKFAQWRFLKDVEVAGTAKDGAIITFGDSITDGAKSTPDTNSRWPDVLAKRLQADSKLNTMGVLNEGISGNRLLHDVAGTNALARFDRDVLSQSGARYLIILEGINDIGRTTQPRSPGDEVTAQQIIVALGQMIERAHAHGIKVIGATLTPYVGAGYASDAGEQMRQAVNNFIRTSGRFDGVIDFEKTTQDPAKPGTFAPAFDSGDHLHPADAGYKAMGESIDLKLFER